MKAMLRSPLFRYGAATAAGLIILAFLFPGFIPGLFSSSEFMPHSTCYLQNPKIIWLHVISDSSIGLAYVSISATLAYMVYKATRDIPFHWMFLAFGAFIIACGFTHFMEVWTVWKSVYWLSGYVKVVTAIASVVTAIALFPLVPKVFGLIDSVKVSEQRKQQLVKANDDLERFSADLEKQKAELEVANQELQMFTYSVAHDLRSPLRALQGFSSLLIEDYGPRLDADGVKVLERMASTALKMQNLLGELLQYSRVNRADLPMHTVSIAEAITQGIAAIKPEAEERNARISVPGQSLDVVGNTTIVAQVITNLLSNAIKFVPSDVTPEIGITVEDRGEFVRVSVRDNGIGIEPGQQQRIFKIFERLHSETEYPGTGLGLAIVQRSMEKMDGRVGVDSTPGHGSTFWFELRKVRAAK